jgi:hypothetical protein
VKLLKNLFLTQKKKLLQNPYEKNIVDKSFLFCGFL